MGQTEPAGGQQLTGCQRCLPWCGLGCGAVCIALGFVFGGLFVFDSEQSTLHKVVNSQAYTSTSQKFFDGWVDHSKAADIRMYYWLWNVSNARDVMLHGARPKVTPVGPFSYIQYNYKENVKFEKGGDEVSYNYTMRFQFDPEHTGEGLSEETQVYMPNLPSLGAYWRSSNARNVTPPWGGPPQNGAETCLNTLKLAWDPKVCASACMEDWRRKEIVNYTAHEWLWGIHDPVVASLDSAMRNMKLMGLDFGVRVQEDDLISLQFNNSKDIWNHTCRQKTGKASVDESAQMVEWQSCTTVGTPGKCDRKDWYWGTTPAIGDCFRFKTQADCAGTPQRLYCTWDDHSRECRVSEEVLEAAYVRGTDSYQQKPQLGGGERLTIFLDQLWRSLALDPVGDCSYAGIDSCKQWKLSDSAWENETESNGTNAGFLPSPSGLLNFTTVQAAPIYISRPFFKGSPEAAAMIDQEHDAAWTKGCTDAAGKAVGGCLDPELDPYFQYETWTGMGLSSIVQLQINLRMRDVSDEWGQLCPEQCAGTAANTSDDKIFTKGMQEAYYPMATIKQVTNLRGDFVDRLNTDVLNLVNGVATASKVLFPVLVLLGAGLITVSLRVMLRRREQQRYAEMETPPDQGPSKTSFAKHDYAAAPAYVE